MNNVSAFFTSYSARRNGESVEAIALIVSDGPGLEPVIRFVVVDESGQASVAPAGDLDLYGVADEADEEAST
jgi:hypothetical protein